jgi:hypothetical protein
MQLGPAAQSLARAMLALSRAAGTGRLHIEAGSERCRIAVVAGAASAANASGDAGLLGDWLLRRGELDLHAHTAALRDGAPSRHVGSWLIARGVATEEAVERALRDQLRARILSVFRWRDPHYRFEPGASDDIGAGPATAIALAQLALEAARDGFDPDAFEAWRTTHAALTFSFSPFGRALLDETLFEREAITLMLRRGAPLSRLIALCPDASADQRTLAGLWWLAAIAPAAESGTQFRLLLRKRIELERGVTAEQLLDLDRTRLGDPRKALRRLAGRIHPDSLGPNAPSALRDVSTELMRALLQAEARLRER